MKSFIRNFLDETKYIKLKFIIMLGIYITWKYIDTSLLIWKRKESLNIITAVDAKKSGMWVVKIRKSSTYVLYVKLLKEN